MVVSLVLTNRPLVSTLMGRNYGGGNGYRYLDSKPLTISAQEHRPAYSSDGDYFSKPSVDDVFDKVYDLVAEATPDQFPEIY